MGARLPPHRQIVVAAMALALIAAGSSVSVAQSETDDAVAAPSETAPAAAAPAAAATVRCADPGVAVLAAPIGPWVGAPLRVIFTVEDAADGELSLTGPDGAVAAKSAEKRGGPPYFWLAEV